MSTLKRNYILEGLCCGNCAAKIEKDARLLEGVKSVKVNTATTVLSIEYSEELTELTEAITRIAVSHDEDIVVKEA